MEPACTMDIPESTLQLPEFWNPSRGSFATGCLKTVVSKMGLEIEVAYYEKQGGVLQKIAEMLVTAEDMPLSRTFMEALPEKFEELHKDPDTIIRCFAGSVEGEEIDMDLKPNEIGYIIDALRNQNRPILYLCKEDQQGRSSSDLEMDLDDMGYLGRTASGMVMDLIRSAGTPQPPSLTLAPSPNTPSSPPTPGSAASEDLFHSDESENGNGILSKARTLKAPQRYGNKNALSGWNPKSQGLSQNSRIHKELYECQESLIPFREIDSNSDSDSENIISHPLSTSLQEDSFLKHVDKNASSSSLTLTPFLGTTKSDITSGYVTLPPQVSHPFTAEKKKRRLGTTIRNALKSTKSRSLDRVMDITKPTQPEREDFNRKWKRQTAIRGKNKRKISACLSPPIPESSYAFQIKSVPVIMLDGVLKELPCIESSTIAELRETVAHHMNKQDRDRLTRWKASDLMLTYKLEGKEYELFNDWQFIYKTALYESWSKSQSETRLPVTVRLSRRDESKDLALVHRISKLAGVSMDGRIASLPNVHIGDLRRIAAADQKEVQWARRTLHSFVEEVVGSRDAQEYALSMELASVGTSTILALKIPIDNKVEVTFHYMKSFSLMRRLSVQSYVDDVLADIFPCVVACGLVEDRIDAYTLQISGEKSYIAGRHALIAFRDIRRCISKGEPVHLSVTEKPSVEDDRPCKLDWLSIDPFSGDPPLHTDITRSSPRDCELQALSVWDKEENFSLRIVKSNNLPLFNLKVPPKVVVEACLYHGDNQLSAPVTTAIHTLEQTIRWKETINFGIATKNIPKAAKIMFVVKEPLHKRESLSSRKGSKFIYWGLTTIFNHQGIMHDGNREKELSLWKGRKEKDKDSRDAFIQLNPCGPTSNNPDSKAASLVIKFDNYSYPVYYPACTPESWSLLLGEGSTKRKQFLRLLEFMKEGKLHSALPAYIEKVNWCALSESLEVYSLLNQVAETKQDFPVEVALKLLDCDFPDEKVREFATRVLEELPNDKLDDFLLQLTQALKFELNHDSFLARFLLKRALRNKRIGHFFFWFLRCEMSYPQFTTRFGVILEAYLKGCGDAMLVRSGLVPSPISILILSPVIKMRQFENKVEMQMRLEEIGKELKYRCNDDHGKMQAMLPEMLEGRGVPKFTVTSVFNPRIQLGNLRPQKCKIMASKKKPQWLEMYNVDPTALRHTPIRLILKLGDDLRQDMITLRMFSLFEKLWEQEGLDLALIPYGCIATGPDTGFIEVVKNARTIAEVSGVSNNTKLFEWIKSHQKNEFAEIDADMVKTAVRTFVHSCAGYSVATYVLGIGDRHNDNIMVTTSGNFFHIDFGHFLGNIKYCMGFKREWAPFVLTPDFVYVMGGEDSEMFETYKNLCCRAFLTLRRHADLIINLFSLMRSTGIPELTCVEDTDYIRNALVLDKTEHTAEQAFRKVIKKCLDLKWTVQVMWRFHLLKKRGSS